jgi:hypothetical protein
MITVGHIKKLLTNVDDSTPIAMSFSGCTNSGTILAVSGVEMTTAGNLIDYDDCGCDEECDCEKVSDKVKNQEVLHFYCNREWF